MNSPPKALSIALERGYVDLQRHVVVKEGQELRLTSREAELVRYLADRPRTVIPWEELHREVWRHARAVLSRAGYFAWRRLVAKVEDDPARPINFLAFHGVGVSYQPPGGPAGLPLQEALVLGALSIFVAPAEPAALAAVLGKPVEAELALLRRRQLVRDDGSRLVPLRRLAPDPELQRRHAAWFAALPLRGISITPAIAGAGADLAAALDVAETAELRSALVRRKVLADVAGGHLREAAERLRAEGPIASPAAAPWLRLTHAFVMSRMGHAAQARRLLEQLRERSTDSLFSAYVDVQLASGALWSGDRARAREVANRALAALEELGDPAQADALCVMATACLWEGRVSEAEALAAQAHARAGDDECGLRAAQGMLAYVRLLRGSFAEAETTFRALWSEPGAAESESVRQGLARSLVAQGRLEEASVALGEVVLETRKHQDRSLLLPHLILEAQLELEHGRVCAAEVLALEAEACRRAMARHDPLPLAILALIAARQGDAALAASRFAEASTQAAATPCARLGLGLLEVEIAHTLGDAHAAASLLRRVEEDAARAHWALEVVLPSHSRLRRALELP